MEFKSPLIQNTVIFLFIAILSFPVFAHMEKLPIRIWDEGRLSMNAIEMSQNGNYIVTYYEGQPDHWNTKPPLMIWLQVIMIKLFGIRELSMRMPSAIAVIFTFIALIWFSKKYLDTYIPGMIAAMVLATTECYLNYHIGRTGDYDALLTLFSTLTCLEFFLYIETNKKRYFIFTLLFLVLSVYTKSIQSLLLLPGIVIYLIHERKFTSVISKPSNWIGALISVLLILAYYILRNIKDPGFINNVAENELGGRYLTVQSDQNHPFTYYFSNLVESRMKTWWIAFPIGIITGLLFGDNKIKKLSRYILFLAVTYLLIISMSQTKLAWYDAPALPFLALGCSILIYTIVQKINNAVNNDSKHPIYILSIFFLLLLFVMPYQSLINRNHNPIENYWEKSYYNFSYYLKGISRGKIVPAATTICYKDHKAHLYFYTELINKNQIIFKYKDYTQLNTGDSVLVVEDEVKNYVRSNYSMNETNIYENVDMFVIK